MVLGSLLIVTVEFSILGFDFFCTLSRRIIDVEKDNPSALRRDDTEDVLFSDHFYADRQGQQYGTLMNGEECEYCFSPRRLSRHQAPQIILLQWTEVYTVCSFCDSFFF